MEITMTKTISATYKESAAVKNVLDDLINHGIDREKIHADEKAIEVSVTVSVTILEQMEEEVREILNRHHPA